MNNQSKAEIEYWEKKAKIDAMMWQLTKELWMKEHTMKVEKHEWDKQISNTFLEKTTLELQEQRRKCEMAELHLKNMRMQLSGRGIDTEEDGHGPNNSIR